MLWTVRKEDVENDSEEEKQSAVFTARVLDSCPEPVQGVPYIELPSDDEETELPPMLEMPKSEQFKYDMLKCSVYALQTHGLINETIEVIDKLEDPDWLTDMYSHNTTIVRHQVGKTLDPFTRKLMGSAGYKVANTMPM